MASEDLIQQDDANGNASQARGHADATDKTTDEATENAVAEEQTPETLALKVHMIRGDSTTVYLAPTTTIGTIKENILEVRFCSPLRLTTKAPRLGSPHVHSIVLQGESFGRRRASAKH